MHRWPSCSCPVAPWDHDGFREHDSPSGPHLTQKSGIARTTFVAARHSASEFLAKTHLDWDRKIIFFEKFLLHAAFCHPKEQDNKLLPRYHTTGHPPVPRDRLHVLCFLKLRAWILQAMGVCHEHSPVTCYHIQYESVFMIGGHPREFIVTHDGI